LQDIWRKLGGTIGEHRTRCGDGAVGDGMKVGVAQVIA